MIPSDRIFSQQQIYNFLRTIAIKFDPIAQELNSSLLRRGIAVSDDKTTWKYYLNMVGQYHPSDTKMYVTSIDTQKTILFSVENLNIHLRTRSRYVPGGIYYNRLCESYPDQVDLIKSILFPVESINEVILADDLTLVGYGHGYLEDSEESIMIMKIEKFLEIYKERWYFDFLDDEPYFYLTVWSGLITHLAGLLIVSRLEHIKTPYVHSSDIWNALKTEGIDNYSDILDREKAMLLYQNIEYFKQNAGKQSNLLILADRILSDFGIGLYGRIVVQETDTSADNYQLTPQLAAVRLPQKNDRFAALVETKTVATVQSELLEKGLTDTDSAELVATVERKLGDTVRNEFSTKFLELRPVAQNKPFAEILNIFLLETLTLCATKGYYNHSIEIKEPLTNETLYLKPKEFLALYHYAIRKSMGLETIDFPTKFSYSHSFLTDIGAPEKIIQYNGGKLYLNQIVSTRGFLDKLTYSPNIYTPSEFSDEVTRLWLRFVEHRLLEQKTSIDREQYAFGYLSSFCHTKRDETITLVDNYASYEEWFGPEGLDITDSIIVQYNLQDSPKEQWENFADRIMSTLLPINKTLLLFGNFTLSNNGYSRLRQLFTQLCSYRVVFLQADRETQYNIKSGKWSTTHGPNDMHQYGDFVSALKQNTSSKTLITHDWSTPSDVTDHVATKAVGHTDYSVGLTSIEIGSKTIRVDDHRHSVMITTMGATMSQGSFTLTRPSVQPIMVDDQ